MKKPCSKYYLSVIEGLERFASQEIRQVFRAKARVLFPGRVKVEGELDPMALSELKVPEDVFVLLSELDAIGRSRNELGRIFRALVSTPSFYDSLRSWSLIAQRKIPKKVRYRVITRKKGQHNFLRKDLERTVYSAIQKMTSQRWEPVVEHAHLEIWVELHHDQCLVGLRASDRSMRHRTYKVRHIEASLRPTVAHVMAKLTAPQQNDVFCDPMCGAGTILIERAELERYNLLLGGDKNPDAIAAARQNIGPRYKPIELKVWDAADLPIDAQSVSSVATNPPFGRKIGSLTAIEQLYPQFLKEMFRVIRPGGALVILTDNGQLLSKSIDKLPFRREGKFPITLLGHKAVIYKFIRV